ncbi:MAG: hypothetical protein J0L52_07265 [Caulobacterales bacterium]|nr:hypothetical protein [Caulobacterales bacterium]
MRLIASLAVAASALTLAACEPTDTQDPSAAPEPAGAPSAPDADALTAEGWGPLRIGMTLDEVTAAAGPDSDPEAIGGPDPESCDQFRPEQAPEGLLVMIEQGVLTRISIMEPSALRTDQGFGIGATATQIKAAYGDAARVEPHHYLGLPAEYITVWTGGVPSEPYVQDSQARGISYETNGDGVVTLIHVGGPSIQYVEGCA